MFRLPVDNNPAPAPAVVRDELARVLSAPAFAGARGHQRLLQHLVEHTLAGNTAQLKETVLGIEVFGRPAASFDPRLDSIVRVEGRRLRQRLDRHYRSSAPDVAVVIDLPKGSYVPRFRSGTPLPKADSAARAAARELVQRGEFLLQIGHEEGHRKALARFSEAALADPGFAEAHWGVACAHTALVNTNREPPRPGVDLAEAAVRRALAIDPRDGRALAMLALLRQRFQFDWSGARTLFAEALRHLPVAAYVRHTLALGLLLRGDFDAAEAELAVARTADPLHLGQRGHEALLHLYRRDWPQALVTLDALLDMSPDNALGLSLAAYVQLCRGDAAAALAGYRRVAALHPQLSIGSTGAAQALASLGRGEEARALLAALSAEWGERRRYLSPYQLALVSVRLGDVPLALRQLRQAVEQRDPNAPCLVVDPGFDALRQRAAFSALQRQVLGG